MQLNGTNGTTMAASEPPEPPPRNPDKINASLKQTNEMKTNKTKDFTTSFSEKSNNNNNNKSFKSILSLDNNNSLSGIVNRTIDYSEIKMASTPKTAIINGGDGGDDNNNDNNDSNSKDEKNNIEKLKLQIDKNGITNTAADATNEFNNNSIAENNPINSQASVVQKDNNNIKEKNNQNRETKQKDELKNYNDKCIGGSNGNNNNNNNCNNNDDNNNENDNNNNNNNSNNNNNNNNNSVNNRKTGQQDDQQTVRLRLENERLIAEIIRLKKLLENSTDGAVGGIELQSDNNSFEAQSTDGSTNRFERLEVELKAAKEQISHLRVERKKLRSDKIDLLAHVKQLCASLQDKEQELRDFIRNFEHRMRETESSSAKLTTDRERERWSLLKHARDEAERSLALAAQLNARDIQLQRTQEQLQEARRQLSSCMSDQESLLSFAPLTPPSGLLNHNNIAGPSCSSSGFGSNLNTVATNTTGGGGGSGDRGSCSADSGVRGSSDKESTTGDLNLSDGTCDNGPCITVDPDSISLVSSHHMYQFGTPKERSPTLSPLNLGAFSRSIDSGTLSRSVEQLGSPVESEGPPVVRRIQSKGNAVCTINNRSSGGRGGSTWGSISRVFARTRHRNKNNTSDNESMDFQWSPLTEEGYAEKLRLLREASSIPIERWRASQVLAWLEVALGMPQYSTRCSENVKSGKVLLELNDGELETGLGLTHPMHRKKLRLAIEEQRRPELIRYPTIGQLGHTWVASEWLPDIGLPQYAESFLHSLVDARMLDTLSKKELEKFLSVTRKFHQASIVHGIHVLRILKYDRQALAMRRLQCESIDADPIVWTNQRFIRWARSIDLSEYAENLKDSGVHGGLVVLEPSFSGDTMATALGIPPSKNIIRRHLSTEFESLILPARYVVFCQMDEFHMENSRNSMTSKISGR